MVVVPAAIADTTPLALKVATAWLLFAHTPPVVALVKVVVEDAQTLITPVIGATEGSALTVTVAVTVVVQPALLVTA
jgi:hypothetical protein